MDNGASHLARQWPSDIQDQIIRRAANEALILFYPICRTDTASDGLDGKIREVSEITGLNTYTVRQKLIGASIDVLCGGSDLQRLGDVTDTLTKAGYQAALISKKDLTQNKKPIRAVSARFESDANGGITFLDINGAEALRWRPESALLIVVGSLAPEQYGTSKALLASLSGGIPDISNSARERLRDISKHQPGLILAPEPNASPVFVDGSLFNYEFMGDKRSFSQAQNFLALIETLQNADQSGQIHLDTDFGRKKLPVGRLATKPKVKSDTRKMLALYAKLIGLAQQQGFFSAQTQSLPADSAIPQSNLMSDYTKTLAEVATTGSPSLLHRKTDRPLAKVDESRDSGSQSTRLPAPPASESRSLAQKSLRALFTNARRFGPPPLVVSCVILTMVFAIASSLQPDAFIWRWSFLPIGIAFSVASLTYARRQSAIARLPTSRIRSLPMGLVEVKGLAKRKYALQAPHSLVNCIYYSYRVLERTTRALSSGVETNSWRVVSRGDSGHIPFYLEDETARVLVDPLGAVISGAQTNEYTSSFADLLSGVTPQSDRRIIETVIPEDTELYVIGHAHPSTSDPHARRKEYRARLKALKADPNLLRQYDADGDGAISFEEWALAKADFDNRFLREDLLADRPEDTVVVGRHPAHEIFFISTSGESDILSSYRWKVPALGAIGFVFLLEGLWELIGKLG